MIALLTVAWPNATASAQTPTPTEAETRAPTEAETRAPTETPTPAPEPTETPKEDQWGEKTPPKNYVRSKEPAKSGHAYNWTQMAYASGLMACMGLFIVWLIRRNQREPKAK